MVLRGVYAGKYCAANGPRRRDRFGEILPMGPPSKVFLGHGGIHLNGVQTDTQINFDAMLKGTYNYQVVHFWRDSEALKGLVPAWQPAGRLFMERETLGPS